MSSNALGRALVALKSLSATARHQMDLRDRAIAAVEAALTTHSRDSQTYVAGMATFLDVREHRPPTARKVLLLTPAKVCIIGPYTGWEIGWHPLPDAPDSLK